MKISVYSIEKSQNQNIKNIIDEFIKMGSNFAEIKNIAIFNNKIASAQIKSEKEAKISYSEIYEPYLKNGYNIALDENGEEMGSVDFSKIFDNGSDVRFFIGGAYGFEDKFLRKVQKVISLSRLTYAHKIAKIVLFEQIFRGLCIKNNHPYHKNSEVQK